MTRRGLVCAVLVAAWLSVGCGEASVTPLAPHLKPVAPPPPPTPAGPAVERPTVRLPDTVDFELANGLRVFLVPNHEVPLVSFQLRLEGGSREDPAGKEGVAELLSTLLGKGAGERDAAAFQEQLDFVGGAFGAAAGPRSLVIAAEFLTADLELGMGLLADVLLRPRLTAEEFEKERDIAEHALAGAREDPSSLIGTYYRGWLLAGHPAGRPISGDEESLASLTLEDVRAAARRQLAPRRTLLAIAGDFDPAAVRKLIEQHLGSWTAAGSSRSRPPAPTVAPGGHVLLVDKPDALQTYFQFGGPGVDWTDPRYPARYLANTILGGRFTSRLNSALRIESGLTYGAGSSFDDLRHGLFEVSSYTATETSAECLAMARDVYVRFRAEGLTQEELDSARAYVQGQYAPEALETAEQVASMVLSLAADDLPRDQVDGFFQRLDALTLAQVNAAIQEVFPAADRLSWVVIGRADELQEILATYGTVTRVSLEGPGFAPARGR